ncbi:MAG: hypothetical protein K2Y28_12670 [Burkholderiaceae bacterium]|nr:hypothetical protein [Burkholderiaceae bacterium]
MKKIDYDFESLTAEIFKANAHDVGAKLIVQYCVEYPQAIAQAIEQRNYSYLIRLLDAREPIHPCLNAALAQAFRTQEQGKISGKAPILTTYAKGVMISEMKQMYYHKQAVEKIKQKISIQWGVNTATVKRIWTDSKIKDKSSKFCDANDCRICIHFEEMLDDETNFN